jgi:type III pantothenate kinase
MIVLAIDLGNTRAKMARFNNGVIEETYFGTTISIHNQIKDWRIKNVVDAIIICSVVTIPTDILEATNGVENIIQLAQATALPFESLYTTMDTLGGDRLALIAGAVVKYPNEPTLVIALGTCITYNFVNQKAQFLGGGISPGLKMRLKAMHHFTQKLPMVVLVSAPILVGNSTTTSLQSGAINGMLAEIEGIIAAYEAEYGKINVVLTGGDMPQFESRIKKQIFADANFLFEGLYAIVRHNFIL